MDLMSCNEEEKWMEIPEILSYNDFGDNIVVSGAVYTRDTVYNRPYYVILYDEIDGKGKTKWIAKNVSREFLSERFYNLIKEVREIEDAFPEIEAFVIEFNIDSNANVNIIKTNRLEKVINMARAMTDKEFADTKSFAKCTYLDTNHILSDCAYWNPLDQLGTNPRPLDYSLFREVITVDTWNRAIRDLGYTEVNGELMQKVGNKPYVSINYTFEGLTPNSISAELRYKLYHYYEKKLRTDRKLHTKLETVVLNTYDFSTDEKLQNLLNDGFKENEIAALKDGLYRITNNILVNYQSISEGDRNSLQRMTEIRREIRRQQPVQETNVMKLYKYIKELLDSICLYATPQYTRQTRCAFLAKELCETLTERGYFSEEEMENFMTSITTISTEIKRDIRRYTCGEMTREEFNSLYGHLRSGIFDIRTDCFAKIHFEPNQYMSEKYSKNTENENSGKLLDANILKTALTDIGLSITPERFIDFIIKCLKNKEIFKFELTKTLNLMLETIARLGEVLGIAREDMSYLEIQDLLSYHSRDSYIQIIQSRRDMYHANTYLILPDLIFNVGDIDVIKLDRKMNFKF